MTTRALRLTLLLAPLVAGALTPRATPKPRQQTSQEAVYERLLERLKAEGTVDFDALRRAYADSPLYDPYNSDVAEWEDSLFSHIEGGDAAGALAFVDSILGANYLYPTGHLGAAIAYESMGDSALAHYHQVVLSGLINSIAASGTGESPETALVVMFVAEEYAYLGARGLESSSQALTTIGDTEYDVLEVRPISADTVFTLYFDVSHPSAWLKALLSR